MPCKHDHAAPGMLPAFLCRACHPELRPISRPTAAENTPTDGLVMSGTPDMYRRKQRRRLRAEWKAARERTNSLRDNRHASATMLAKAEARESALYKELALLDE
jgi:hypothetical protein